MSVQDPDSQGWENHREAQRSVAMILATALAITMMAATLMLPVPFAISRPGPTIDVLGDVGNHPFLTIQGAQTYPADEDLSLVTISISGGPATSSTMGMLVQGLLSPEEVVQPVRALYPESSTSEDVDEQSAAEMSSSQAAAAAAALGFLGKPATSRVDVVAVPQDSPAVGKLEPGDVLTKIGDHGIETVEDVQDAGNDLQVNVPVTVAVKRASEAGVREYQITPALVDGVPRLGITIKAEYDFGVDVTFATQDIGGPSAGLVFALALVERMTPDNLVTTSTAATGTMTPDGTVGPIGGVALKMISARRAGAQWFLAPQQNCSGVVGNIPQGLNVVAVNTLEEAVAALESIGKGDTAHLPQCPDQHS